MVVFGTAVDWSNPGFLRFYGQVFALASALTAMMWLVSVVKRAVRGVPLGQAVTENIGYLLLSVVVTAFAPLAVCYVVGLVDSAAEALLGEYILEMFVGGALIFAFLGLIIGVTGGFGAIIAIPIALMLILAVFGLWVMLVVRSAMILLGLVFGPLVFSGLVDKDLWGHTRKWAGIMGGIIASKFGMYLALGLAGAILDGATDIHKVTFPQAVGGCITFLALLFLALLMPFQVAKWLPFVGDELQAQHQAKSEAGQRAKSFLGQAAQKKDGAMQARAQKSGPGGGSGPAAGGKALETAAGPAVAGAQMAREQLDNVRDQVVQAAEDGANNGASGGQGDGSAGSAGRQGGGTGKGGASGNGNRPRGGSGGSSGGTRRPAPPPTPRSGSRAGGGSGGGSRAGDGSAPAPPPTPRSARQAPPPSPSPPPSGDQAPPPPSPAQAPLPPDR
ncbi:hypothetical protein ABT272_28870 [Streptomyces sp900105245]|uniref:Integral membrane protein n=1 Tax=Streptomyces sp. 900105245 TaxID=3154379 RepID=A0ABV1UDR4_9ACTN